LYWTRPEDITATRPFYYVKVKHGATDLVASMTAALASSAAVFQNVDPPYYNQLMSWAIVLYGISTSVSVHL
jgi:Glycosyl hydrolase family 9